MKGGQVLGVFGACARDCGESAKEITDRGRELVAADESTLVAKPLLDTVVVEDNQGDGSLPDSTGTNESERGEGFCKVDDFIDQLVTPETRPWWPGRKFTRYADSNMRLWIHR